METNNLNKLRFKDVQNFCDQFIERVENASTSQIINALYQLSLVSVMATATPDTDRETKQVVAVYVADEALVNNKIDLLEILQKRKTENSITDSVAFVQ